MTFRQVYKLLKVIDRADTVDFYHQILSYGIFHVEKMPTLEEFLNLSSNEGEPIKSFDEKTDKFLEMQALKRLQERKVSLGK